MKRSFQIGLFILVFLATLWLCFTQTACSLKDCAVSIPATLTPNATPGITFTPTVTNTPICTSFADNYANANSLNNYNYYLNSSQQPTNAAACDYNIVGNFLEVNPTSNPGQNNGGIAEVTNSLFNYNLTHYTVTADFEMDNYTMSEGLFGISFYTGSDGSFYSFQWDGNFGNANGGTPDWELERDTGYPAVSFVWIASGSTSFGYTTTTTITLQVEVTGSNFLCYVNLNDGTGFHLIYNASDTTYTSGGVGIRTYGVHQGNKIDTSNFYVSTCP